MLAGCRSGQRCVARAGQGSALKMVHRCLQLYLRMGGLHLLPGLLELALALHAALPQLLLRALSLLQAALQIADLVQGSLELLWTHLQERAQTETAQAGFS